MFVYRKTVITSGMLAISALAHTQLFNPDTKELFVKAVEKNDTLRIYSLRKQQSAVDLKNIRYSFLPRISFNATYTRLNDDIVFPSNLQSLLLGTQALLIKEKAGIPFNTSLPPSVKLQEVAPVQKKDILKTSFNGQLLLFSGFKVTNGIRAIQHQQKSYDYLADRQNTRLFLEIADVYDKTALVYASDAIISSSEKILSEQSRFIESAIKNGLAIPLDRKKIELARQRLILKKLENESSKRMLAAKMNQLTAIDPADFQQMKPQLIPAIADTSIPLKERPEIKALNEGISALRYKEKAELTEYVPKLAFFGQYEARKKELSLFDPQWYAGVRLQWNLFDGLTAKNNAKKIALERKTLEVQKESAGDLLKLAYIHALEDYRVTCQKIILKKTETDLAESTFEYVEKQYKNGLTTISELLIALNDAEKAKFELLQIICEQRKAALQVADLNGTLLNSLK